MSTSEMTTARGPQGRAPFCARQPGIVHRLRRPLAWIGGLCLAGVLAACGGDGGSGDGGSSGGGATPPDGPAPQSLVFSYPFDGQQSVPRDSQIVLRFTDGGAADVAGQLALENANGDSIETDAEVTDNGNVVSLNADTMTPDTEYVVYNDGDELFRFTTARPPNTPSADGFQIQRATGQDGLPFFAFHTIRMRFTETVNPTTVHDGGLTVTNADTGATVEGALYVKGRNVSFDPEGDLEPGEYTVNLDGVKSIFGNELDSNPTTYQLTARAPGSVVKTDMDIASVGGDSTANSIEVEAQILGENDLDVEGPAQAITSRVAQQVASSARLGQVLPVSLSRGGSFNVSPLEVRINGEVPANLTSGTLRNTFITDLSAYFTGNPFNEDGAIGVRLYFDVAVSGSDERGNGAFNQSVLGAVAVGTVDINDDGGLVIDSVGSFPVSVNRTGRATTNFRLRLSAPATDTGTDMTQPRITAQYPSACLYTFGETTVSGADTFEENQPSGLTTLSMPEQNCTNELASKSIPAPYQIYLFQEARASNFPLRASPAVTFSEPMDPASLEGNIQLTDGSGTPVDVQLWAEGSTVVVDPVEPLDRDTDYTLTVSNAVTDLAGNGLQGSYPDVAFTTETMVTPMNPDGTPADVVPTEREAVRQTAPFLTVLTPGMPCPLQQPADEPDADFRTGGDIAGRCVGDVATDAGDNPPFDQQIDTYPEYSAPTSAEVVYPVFDHPSNVAIQGEFSKPVKVDTVQLADGCLVGGGPTNTNLDATMAIQRMDGDQCEGVVDGELQFRHPEDALTRGFSFRPVGGFESDQRYWIVICGSPDGRHDSGASQCSSGKSIRGQNGLTLNTNSLLGTGTEIVHRFTCAPPGVFQTRCFDDNRGQGGPDIVMPFEGAPATEDFYAVQRALPNADSNGNGLFDNRRALNPGAELDRIFGSTHSNEDTLSTFDDSLGRERAQLPNTAFIGAAKGVFGITSNYEAGLLGGSQVVAIRQRTSGEACSAAMAVMQENGTRLDTADDVPAVGDSAPETCVPVDLLPGGLTTTTSVPGGGVAPSGQILLRIPYVDGEPQRGYIVPQCRGTLKQVADADSADPLNSGVIEEPYNYQPCFVANLTITVNANDGQSYPAAPNVIPQQDLNVQVYGPVAFEQNGRMVVATTNANTFTVRAYLAPNQATPIAIPTDPGEQRLQLVGPPVHGGPVQALKVP